MRQTHKLLPVYFFWACYLAGLFYLASNLNLSVDESFTLNTTSYSLKKVIAQSYTFEGQPPLYFILIAAWRLLADTVFFIRLFSILSIAGAVFYFYKLILLLTKSNKTAFGTSVLFAVNPFTIWAATDMRPFALVIFLAAAALFLFYKYYVTRQNKWLFFFAAVAAAGSFTQYLFVFYLAGLGAGLLFANGWQMFKTYMLFILPVAIIFFISLFYAGNQVQLAVTASVNLSPLQRAAMVLHSPQNLMLCAAQLPFIRLVRWFIFGCFIIFFITGIFKWFKNNNAAHSRQYIKLAGITALTTCFLITLFFTVLKIDYYDKYFAVIFPLLCLFISIVSIYKPPVQYLFFTATIALYLFVTLTTYRQPVKGYDNEALAAYVYSIEKKDEPLFFYQHVLALPFKYAYKGKNNVYTLPDSLRFDSSYLKKITDSNNLKKQFGLLQNGQFCILITDRNEAVYKQAPDIQVLENFLSNNFTSTLDTLFTGRNPAFILRVRRLQKKS